MIASGFPVYAAPVAAEGFLFVGDPHLSSARPGRRIDADWPNPILAKLARAVEIANERGLVMILLGDFYNESMEPDEALKTRSSAILKKLWLPAVTNVGNHDMAYTTLAYGDSLAYMAVSDVLDAVTTSGPALSIRMGDRLLGLGMTPYGQEIPRDVRGMFPDVDGVPHDGVVWVTHHDIAFSGAYPGAALPFPIEGCAMVVNGHMHKTLPPMRVGGTRWYNIGNINRQSVDLMDHVPCAWALGKDRTLTPIALPHEAKVFDLTGKLVAPMDPSTDRADEPVSRFVEMLKAEGASEMGRSDDGSIVLELMEAKLQADSVPDDVASIVRNLWSEAVARRRRA